MKLGAPPRGGRFFSGNAQVTYIRLIAKVMELAFDPDAHCQVCRAPVDLSALNGPLRGAPALLQSQYLQAADAHPPDHVQSNLPAR